MATVGYASGALAAAGGQEDDIDEAPYLWSDLVARRTALGVKPDDMARLLRIDIGKYYSRETGALGVGPYLAEELIAMGEFVDEQVRLLVDESPPAGVVVLDAVEDAAQMKLMYPRACTLRDEESYPVALADVAVGRAAAALTRAGREVEVRRASRRADLGVRRLAVGLGKNETAALLGLNTKSYYNAERGTKAPPAGTLGELQAIDDFITSTAEQLEVTVIDGVSVVMTIDDQAQFEHTYPQARTQRNDAAYPHRVHHIAAARRAETLEAAGESTRIAIPQN